MLQFKQPIVLRNIIKLVWMIYRFVVIPMVTMPFRMIAFLIPKDKDLWLVGSYYGQHINGNAYFFLEYLQRKQVKKRIVVLTRNKQILKRYQNSLYSYSLRAILLTSRASLAFVTNFAEEDLNFIGINNKLKIVNLWHGTPIKNISWTRPEWWKRLLSLVRFQIPSPDYFTVTKTIEPQFLPQLFKLEKRNIKETGYPRNDFLLGKRDSLPTKLSYLKHQRYAVYAPTYRPDNMKPVRLSKQLLVRLNEWCEELDYYFYVLDHPTEPKIDDVDRLSRIQYPDRPDKLMQPWLKYAGLLITDYSSAAIDFGLLRRPIIFYVPDYKEYKRKVGFCIDFKHDLPGPFAYNETTLINLITEQGWFRKTNYQMKLNKFIHRFHSYIDTKASERILELLRSDGLC
jgi:CDP-glycerol glycerophosphotransferase (TagB/SpsB family)